MSHKPKKCFSITDEYAELRKKVFTLEQQTLPIKDHIGTCWQDLGIQLGLRDAKLNNIMDDYRFNHEKASAVLRMWMDEKGNDATFGVLSDALVNIGKKRIADILLGMQMFLFSHQCGKLS